MSHMDVILFSQNVLTVEYGCLTAQTFDTVEFDRLLGIDLQIEVGALCLTGIQEWPFSYPGSNNAI